MYVGKHAVLGTSNQITLPSFLPLFGQLIQGFFFLSPSYFFLDVSADCHILLMFLLNVTFS